MKRSLESSEHPNWKDTNSQLMSRSKKYKAYVTKTTESLQPNRVLGTEPPEGPDPVDLNDEGIEQDDQVRLPQLRSGFCPKLTVQNQGKRYKPMQKCKAEE